MKRFGFAAIGVQVGRADFARLHLPCLLLEQEHYLVLMSVDEQEATVYDPLYDHERRVKLPPPSDTQFFAIALTTEIPHLKDTR